MSDKTRYQGIITSIDGDTARVRIMEASACEGCKAKAVCNSSEKKEKLIDATLPRSFSKTYAVGDRVGLTVSTALGMKAVWLGFGIPLALLVIGMIATASILNDETLAALAGLCVLIPYYIGLWIFKPKLCEQFRFAIEKGERSEEREEGTDLQVQKSDNNTEEYFANIGVPSKAAP